MNLSDLTVHEMLTAIVTLSIEHDLMHKFVYRSDDQYYKDRAAELFAVISLLDSEIKRRTS